MILYIVARPAVFIFMKSIEVPLNVVAELTVIDVVPEL